MSSLFARLYSLAVLLVIAPALARAADGVLNSSAPKISDTAPESLYAFLCALPGSFEAQLFYGLMISGTAGQFAHYALKWARDEIRGNLVCYLWINKKSTALAFFTFVGIAVTAIASGAFTGQYGGFVGWKMVFWMGVTNGFTIDAIVNKTERARWTLRERQVRSMEKEKPL